MKTGLLLTYILSAFTMASYAQVENDDMYFNAKDRAALRAKQANEMAYSASEKPSKKMAGKQDSFINPTDSYSARNVNPEYEARSNAQSVQSDNGDYFVNDYQYQNARDLNNWNNNFNDWYGGSWYNANYWSPYINSWNTPYYGSPYDAWGNPWNNPYYRSGWSSAFSYHWGRPWNYGWNSGWSMSFGYGNFYDPWWGPSYRYSYWNNPYSYWGGGYGYPGVVIVEDGRRHHAYGKRTSRSSNPAYTNSGTGRNTNESGYRKPTENGRTATGARMNSNTSRQTEYYNRSWRSESRQESQRSSYTAPTRSSSTGRSYSNDNSNSTWRQSTNSNSNSNSSYNRSNSNSSYTPSRSSSSGGSRSSSSPSRSSRGR